MKINIDDPDFHEFYVVDKDINEVLENVVKADEESGEYEILKKDEMGRFIINRVTGGIAREKKKGNVQIIMKRYLNET